MDNIKKYLIDQSLSDDIEEITGDFDIFTELWCKSEDVTELEKISDIRHKELKKCQIELGEQDYKIQSLEFKVMELTDKLIKSNKGYCPERIGYEVHYKYLHNNCNGLDCDKCVRDQIEKGLTDVGSNKETK